MMRCAVIFAVLLALASTHGYVQDQAGGVPVAFGLEVLENPDPWYVSGKPALLKIIAVDQHGRPSMMNGIVARLKTTDPKSKLNNFDVGLVNGTAVLKLQWFTPSDAHSIQASGTGGITGETNGIKEASKNNFLNSSEGGSSNSTREEPGHGVNSLPPSLRP
jgi:hypothetical protein